MQTPKADPESQTIGLLLSKPSSVSIDKNLLICVKAVSSRHGGENVRERIRIGIDEIRFRRAFE
jgi:hypothetical protein